MPGHTWADEPRLQYLQANIPGYEAAQEHKKTSEFLGIMINNYFAKFPATSEAALALETKRISTWMNNHSGGRGKKNGVLLRATRVTFCELLLGKLERKKRQKLQPTQAYSQLYYKSKLKNIIQSEWESKLKSKPQLLPKAFLAYRNKRVKEFYDAKSQDVKAQVDEYRNNKPTVPSKLQLNEDELPEDEQSRRIEARERQMAIDNVEAIMTEIVREIEEVTGLKSHFMLGGPEPKRNGRMVMFTITAGRSILNNRTFKEQHPDYKRDVQDNFFSFVKGCFSKEDREKYSNVPFPDSDNPPSGIQPVKEAPFQRASVPNPIEKTNSRKRARSSVADTSDTSESDNSGVTSNSEDDSDSGKPPSPMLEKPMSTGNDVEDDEDIDIFSPHLPDARRIVDTKKDARGLTLHQTAEGKWLSEAELHRMANIARNSLLMKRLGLEEAKRRLTARSGGENDKEPEGEDYQEFSAVHAHSIPKPRESFPRRSKANVTYGERKDKDELDPGMSVSLLTTSSSTDNGDAIDPARLGVVTNSNVNVAVSIDTASEPNLRQASPADSVSSPSSPQPVSSTSDATPMDVDVHAGLLSPMEVDNHTSFDDISVSLMALSQSSATRLQESVRPFDLDNMDLSKIPHWLQHPLAHLRKKFRGEVEDNMLSAFVALEMAWQPFEKRIGTNDRPEAVTWWIKNARPIDKVPPCIDLASFPRQVRAWWLTIQPRWRTPILEDWPLLRDVPDGEYWLEARFGGANGLFMVLLCLYWWRRTAEEEADKVSYSEYESVAEDVAFVLEAILKSGVSLSPCSPLTSSTCANSRPGASRKARPPVAEESTGRKRSLRSSGANVGPSRTRRSRV